MNQSTHSQNLSLQNLFAFTITLPIIIPCLNNIAVGSFPKLNRQPIRIEHGKPLNFVSQSDLSFTSRELSATGNRVLRHQRALD